MDNQNTMIEVTVDNDATQRCVGLLKELMAVQEKAMKFWYLRVLMIAMRA